MKEYLATNKALKQQLLAPINEMCYRTLCDGVTGYTNDTMLQILDQLSLTAI